MNLPNKLTMLRVLLIPVFMVLMGSENYLAAVVIFAVASFTDYLDGNIARKRGLVTDFGKFMDPLADKILTTTAIIYMVAQGLCHPIVLIIIMAREFAVAGVRMIAAETGKVIAANIFGKIKTVLQMVSIIAVYLMLGLETQCAMGFGKVTATGVSLVSGVIYLWDNRQFFANAK
ncbi:MAG: CDP-diacylglycerol--glycerol-3-phosphate 3-phosphatidyltransferase [Pygmaiobacter sp.]